MTANNVPGNRTAGGPFSMMAEREGFEPSKENNPLTRLAGERLRPLGHLSVLVLFEGLIIPV